VSTARRSLIRRVLLMALVYLTASTLTEALAQTPSHRTVLAIQWGPEDFPPTAAVNEAIQKSLRSDPAIPIDYFVEHLDSDVFAPEVASRSLAGYIREKYRGRAIDVVIAIADPALRFVLDYRNELFAGVPIVYSGVSVPADATGHAIAGLTGVLRGVAYGETLKVALALHPLTEHVFVVARSPDSRVIDAVKTEFNNVIDGVRVTFVDEPTIPQLIDVVRSVPQRSLIIYIFYSGVRPITQGDVEIAGLVASAAAVPVYGTNERYIGEGVVGGVVRGTRETAARVGELALEILRGVPIETLPIEQARLVPTFDWRQLRRWGVDESSIRPGSSIHFRAATIWEQYRAYIVATIIIVISQSLLIAGLVVQRARRRRVEVTLRSSIERSRLLAVNLINADEATRAAVARDLHDGVCQELIGVSMSVASLKRSSGRIQDAETQRALMMLHEETRTVCETLRHLSHELHPTMLPLVGLASALKAHCAEFQQRQDTEVEFRSNGDLGGLRPDVVVCLFRIAQEAMRNASVHGAAKRLTVALDQVQTHVELLVADDGRGFDVDAIQRANIGLGLVSMQERARGVGATVAITSTPGQGTTIRVRAPIRSDVNNAATRRDLASTV
jgi:signal transduction histidine kinase